MQPLTERYARLRTAYVEPPQFVGACIRNRRYAHKPVPQRPMSGRPDGRPR